MSVNKQEHFGKDGLYSCGFWIAINGIIPEISFDAQKIARDVAKKENKYRD